LLIEKINNSDATLIKQYSDLSLQIYLFHERNLLVIDSILKDYNLLVTKLLIINLKSLNPKGKRIIQQNLPVNLEKLQCLFLESFSIFIYVISYIKFSHKNNATNAEFLRFKTKTEFLKDIQKKRLMKTKYFFSTKSIKIKKDLPKIVKDNLAKDSILAKRLVEEYNLKLQLKLIKKINIKSICKSYKLNSIKRGVTRWTER